MVRGARDRGNAPSQLGDGSRCRAGVERPRVRDRRARTTPAAANRDALMPVITISRMYGSGGSEVAERVAQTLGWALFDNAMIDAVAERSGLTVAEVSAQ